MENINVLLLVIFNKELNWSAKITNWIYWNPSSQTKCTTFHGITPHCVYVKPIIIFRPDCGKAINLDN